MTVGEWIERRAVDVPASLRAEVLAALGGDAEADESETSARCMGAASRLLGNILRERAFGRDSALSLLTVDALTTYAFDHAAEGKPGAAALREFARRAAGQIGQLIGAR
jgi:hypothetical protein